MGWSNFLHDFLSGGDRPVSDPAGGGGFFGPNTVGGGWKDYLTKMYATDTVDSPQYVSQSTALRDVLSRNADAQKEEFGAATNAGGFFDSGARLAGLGEINRNQMSATSAGLTEILARLEQQKLAAAAPFLAAQIGGFSAYQNALLGEENAGNYRANAHAQAVIQGVGAGMGAGGGGGNDGPTGGYVNLGQQDGTSLAWDDW